MLSRVLEPEVMDSPEEARAYDAMDHGQVNRAFVADFLALPTADGPILDVGTGTAQIPIELCRSHATCRVVAVDLAGHMLDLARTNVDRAGLADRIALERIDAKGLPYPAASFAAVISNSIVHHIPEPRTVLREMARVLRPGGTLFVRDLLRPTDDGEVRHLVATYAAEADDQQRGLFEASLRAALTVAEMQDLVASLGFPAESVCRTSDRHWTWALRTAGEPS